MRLRDFPLRRPAGESWGGGTRQAYVDLIPVGRYGEIEEMADAAAFLAGEQAAYMNGHILFVDGGYTAIGIAEE